jgi:hypothetical protein
MTPLSIGVQPVTGDVALRRTDSLNGGTAPFSPVPGSIAFGTLRDLAAFVGTAFDLRRDRILFACAEPDDSACCLYPGQHHSGQLLNGHPCLRPTAVSTETAIFAVLGYLDARRHCRQDYWIVLLTDRELPSAAVTVLQSRDTAALSRLVVVSLTAPAAEPGGGAEGSDDARTRLAAAGWQIRNIGAWADGVALKEAFDRIRGDGRPTYVTLPGNLLAGRADIGAAGAAEPAVQGAPEPSLAAESVVLELLTAAVRDTRVIPIVAVDEPPWRRLIEELPERAVGIASAEWRESIPWCGALAEAGCHPVLILTRTDVLAHCDLLMREFCVPQRRATVIVLDESPDWRSTQRNGDAQRCHQTTLPYLPGATVTVPVFLLDALRCLRRSLRRNETVSVLWMPRYRNQSESERTQEITNISRPAIQRVVSERGPVEATSARGRSRGDASPGNGARRRAAPPLPRVFWPPGTRGANRGQARSKAAPSTPDALAIAAVSFSPEIEAWIERYERIGSRGQYLWRWCRHGLEVTSLSCVDTSLVAELCDTKLLAVMYGVMLDDVVDQEHDAEYLRRLIRESRNPGQRDIGDLPPRRRAYAELTCALWDRYLARLGAAPRYGEFAELLAYDNEQVLNTMWYSYLVNVDTRVVNLAEHDLYSPHNMQMMTFATADLMCSHSFDASELGAVRQAVWHAQCMGRIGNLVTTWERELADGDFSSGIFARLIDSGRLRVSDLSIGNHELIRTAIKTGRIEDYFLRQWNEHRRCIEAMVPQVTSVDLRNLLAGLDRLIEMELSSRGLK